MAKEVILTGLRANSEFHLGNYLGGILPMVELQKKHAGKYQLNMFVPDLHSFTTPIDHGKLYEQTHANLKIFVAAGLNIDDPDTFIYRQSYIPAHSELAWILNCFTGFGELSRMTQFNEKTSNYAKQNQIATEANKIAKKIGFDSLHIWNDEVEKFSISSKHKPTEEESKRMFELLNQLFSFKASETAEPSAGLFTYPVLMAADILLYGAKWVPVGEDQRQHVEFARDLAGRINSKFGEIFIMPAKNEDQLKFVGANPAIRIRSLRKPKYKMSKSVDDPAGTIMLSDNPEEAFKKIMSAETDSENCIRYESSSPTGVKFNDQPGVSNLIQILALLRGAAIKDVAMEYKGQTSYLPLKTATADAVKAFLIDFQSKFAAVDDAKLSNKLEADEEAMRQVADATLLKVQKAVGLRPA